MKPPLTVSASAQQIKKSEATVRRMFDAGRLTGIRLANGMRLLDADAVERFATQAKGK